MTYETNTKYYSGQGQVLIAQRDSLGNPKGFRAIGNVSALKIAIATSVIEHKESMTGQRGTDKRLTTEVKVNLSMTVENFSSKNLADALRAAYTLKPATAVTDEAVKGYPGTITGLKALKVSGFALKQNAVTLTPYTNDATPWDYLLNAEAGSFQLNNGSVLAMDKLGIVASAVTVGATTAITVANNCAVGDQVYLRGFTGADAADLNNKSFTVLTVVGGGTGITVNANTTAKTITVAAGTRVTWDGMVMAVDYTPAVQEKVDALTEGAKEVWMRFEGLNTAEDESPVVVNVFKFSTDPLKELDLIADTLQQFVLEGSVLADSQRITGSNYFTVDKLV